MAKVYVQKISEKGQANGYPGLDGTGKVPAAQLPSSGSSGGAAGGVLSGSYPNPGFAVDMATQAEVDALPKILVQQAAPNPALLPVNTLWVEIDGATPPNIIAMHVVVPG